MQTAAIRRVAPADRTKEALDIIVEAVLQAAAQVADVDLHTVDGDAAGHVAQPAPRRCCGSPSYANHY